MQCAASKCVKMLAVCFAALASWALAAPGISFSCYNLCKTRDFESINHGVPLECNCADFFDSGTESKESTSMSLDDTGVYFVPADLHGIQDTFDSQPFFISNPAKYLPKTRNAISGELDSSNMPLNDPLLSQSAHIEIYKKTETISHTTIDKKTDNSPLYLDLEIFDSAGTDRSGTPKYTFIEDFDKTEKGLVKCLDFQVVHYTRKHGQMKEFHDFWEARNLNQYEHWSDIDVEKNINTWCSEPTSIVQNSLHEIKQGLPKKSPDSRSSAIDNTNKMNVTITAELREPEVTTYPLATAGYYVNITGPAEMINESTVAATVRNNVTKTFEPTNNSNENWTSVITTQSTTTNKDKNNENDYLRSFALYNTTTTTTESTLLLEDLYKIETTLQPISSIETKNDLDSMASEDVLHTYVPGSSEFEVLDNDVSNNNASFVAVSTTPLSAERYQETQSTVNDVDVVGRSLIENNTLLNDNFQSPVTDAYSEYRSMYEEEEVNIPKIITKECQNNTVQTIIDGIEELPNNDFRNNESHITGRLYFISNQQLVPLRFVQTNGGTISLGMDGSELCNKLIGESDKKSYFLTVLCKYVQNNRYENKNL